MLRIALASFALAACGGDPGSTGTITATVYGEDFIEEGIPADAFVDGWALSFDSFLVSVGQPAAKAGEGGPEVGDAGFYIVDLAQPSGGEGYELATFEAPAGLYDHYGYALAPDAGATVVNADPADAAEMKAQGYSVWLAGSATKGAETITFDWGFTVELGHAHCEMAEAIDGNDVVMQSTIHADHFFYDDAVSDEPGVAFDLVAASDDDGDGAVTLDELELTDLRAETRYQVGSNKAPDGSDIANLRQYIEYQATTLGHINGEGHCEDVIVNN
jgi:hypothetical protein